MRVAAIDIGTNTTLLLVAERAADGRAIAVEECATITRLGEGVDRTRTLSAAAIARTNECLDRYAEIAKRHGVARVAVVGTSAMRDAGGGEEVRAHVKSRFGVEARTISGDEEARLTFAGALSGLAIDEKEISVFDIGGGSTEVVRGDPRGGTISFARSFDIGSVRLTERHVHTDPPSIDNRAAASNDAQRAFAELASAASERPVVGIAGTMTTLAAVSLKLEPYDGAKVHGHTMTVDELKRVVDLLASLPLAERSKLPGLDPKRADVIVSGGLIALALLHQLEVGAVMISDRGVRWGLAEELLRST